MVKQLSQEQLDRYVSNHAVERFQERFLGHIPNKMTPTIYKNTKTLILRILTEEYPEHMRIQTGIFNIPEYGDIQIVKREGKIVTVQRPSHMRE